MVRVRSSDVGPCQGEQDVGCSRVAEDRAKLGLASWFAPLVNLVYTSVVFSRQIFGGVTSSYSQ